MRDFSIPPFYLGEIGQEVERIGNALNIHCDLAHSPKFKEKGMYSMPTLSHDIVRIASNYDIPMSVTGDIEEVGKQLQLLLTMLRERGISI